MDQIVLISVITGIITAFIYALQGIAEGLTAKRVKYYELALSTQVFALLFMILLVLIIGQSIAISSTGLLLALVLGAIYALSLHFYFQALHAGPMSLVSPISGSYAVVAVPIAILVLGEVVSLIQYLGIVLIIVGVFLIDLKIRHKSIKLAKSKYLLYSLITLVLWGVYMPLDSVLIAESNWITALFWELVFVNIFLSIMLYKKESFRTFNKSSKRFIKASVIIGSCEVIGGLIMNYGLDKGNVSIITPLITLSSVLVVLYATIFLRQKLNKQQAIGVTFALLGVLLIGV